MHRAVCSSRLPRSWRYNLSPSRALLRTAPGSLRCCTSSLPPSLITHLISPHPRRSLVLLPRDRGLQREDVDANITLVNCAFEVWPDRVPSQYDLAACIVLLDGHLSGDLLKVNQVTSDQVPKSVEWAKDYKRVLQHARLLARKTLSSGSPAIAHMKRKLSFVSRRETSRSPQPQYI